MYTKIFVRKITLILMTCTFAVLTSTSLTSAGELVEAGRIAIPGRDGVHMHVDGDYVYVVRRGFPAGPETFSVVNVSDKTAPRIEGQIYDLPHRNAFDLWYGNGYAYTAHRFGGVTMIDVSNPALPLIRSITRSTYTYRGIMSVGHYLYVADHSAGWYPGGIRILDISGNYLNQIGAMLGGVDGRDLAISSDGLYAYQSSGKDDWGTARLYTYDISDKRSPSVVTAIPNIFGGELLISPDDRYLYMTYQEPYDTTPPPKGVKIYDLSSRAQPTEVSTISLTNAVNLAVDYDRKILYVGAYHDPNQTDPGIYVFDIRDPTQPTELYYLRGNAYGDLFYYDNYLYAEELVERRSDVQPDIRHLVILRAYELIIKVATDIKRQSCANPGNVKNKGMLHGGTTPIVGEDVVLIMREDEK